MTLSVHGMPNRKNRNTMNKQTQATSNDMGTLAEDARALMAATADVAGEKVSEARKRLAAALEQRQGNLWPRSREGGRRRESRRRGRARASLSSHRHRLRCGGAHRLSGRAPVLPQRRLITPWNRFAIHPAPRRPLRPRRIGEANPVESHGRSRLLGSIHLRAAQTSE